MRVAGQVYLRHSDFLREYSFEKVDCRSYASPRKQGGNRDEDVAPTQPFAIASLARQCVQASFTF